MITPMQKYDFVIHHLQYDTFLQQLQEIGVLHVAPLDKNDEAYAPLREKSLMHQRITRLIALCKRLAGDKTATGTPDITTIEEGLAVADQIEKQQKSIELAATALTAAQREEETMSVWGDFSFETIDALRNAGHIVSFFSVSSRNFKPEWEEQYNAFVVNEKNSIKYFVTITAKAVTDIEAEPFKLSEKPLVKLREARAEAQKLLASEQNRLIELAISAIPQLEQTELLIQNEINITSVNINTESTADDAIMILEGYCPVDTVPQLEAMLAKTESVYYQSSTPADNDTKVPIKLHNNRFTRVFEPLTGMYGMPEYQEFDPTPILAPFFLLFFAMCLGDCGYGLILILFGLAVKYKKINIEMFDGLGEIITYLGAGTAVVGFILGTGFGIDLYNAAWMPDALKSVMIKGTVAGYDVQMLLALAIGVVHICLAITVKAVCYTKRFGFMNTLSTWGWLLLIVGTITTALLALWNVVTIDIAKWIVIVIGGISALGIYIFNDPKRNPLINIGAGLWDTYNMATGLLGDVLSYIRLFALGLAGGMLGGAFNNLGQMILGDEPSFLLYIPCVIVLLLGHVLNIAMSALGAFVHPLRLTFVEYFKNSGYEGKGTKYAPFSKISNK